MLAKGVNLESDIPDEFKYHPLDLLVGLVPK